jgi:hypothetical protein
MALPADAVPAFRQAPILLVPTIAAVGGGGATTFDATSDGRRFLIRESAGEVSVAAPIQVILNWPALMTSGSPR